MTFGDAGPDRLLASCGIAGPVVFTAAWVVSSLLQTGHGAGAVQLSGLAAMDARDPQIMMAGFIGLGACSVAFGTALGRLPAAGSAGPWLVKAAGVATVAAGLQLMGRANWWFPARLDRAIPSFLSEAPAAAAAGAAYPITAKEGI